MPVKNTKAMKSTESEDTKQSKVKATKKVVDEVESDEEVEETKTTKATKAKATETKTAATATSGKTKGKKAEVVDDESDEEVEQAGSGSEDGSGTDDGSESESEDDSADKKTKEKKPKESFEELSKKLETLRADKKTVNKEMSELEKTLKTKEKQFNDFERQETAILKLLAKTHSDEVNKARKEKPKRKGNVNGGFNKEQPVPEVLVNFLGLAEGTCMARPKVMSALNNKFTELKLKNGQLTTLDKATAKALGLGKEGDGKEIKFTEFQSFLASFYPKKEEKALDV